jgi:tetratricopeptide (TPR) repeat protein
MKMRSKPLIILRNRWFAGLVLLLVCAGTIVRVGKQNIRLKREPGTGLDAVHRTPGELILSRSQALEAVAGGRFDQAYAFYRSLSDADWLAGDCFTLGVALEERKRVVLAAAAFEAARRIDPRHNASARSLDSLRAKFTLATGSERSVLHEAASQGELLRLIGNGAPLGVFVLGIARYANDVGREDELLDRLNRRDHSLLRLVKTANGAIKLTARLLLETGRTPEAVELLESLIGGVDDEGSGSGILPVDHEAAWLLSRAALQLDQHDRADRMLALAADFGTTAAAVPEPAPFVGSQRCGECHLRIAREQQRESRHAQTLRLGSGLKDIPLPAKHVPDPVIPSITHRFSRKSDDRIELETRDLDRVFRAIVFYAVGSGRHGITMLAKDEAGIDRELRVSYFGLDQSWGQTKGIDFAPRDAGDYIGIGLGRKTLNHCLSCHTTWLRSVAPDSSSARGPESDDHGIGCERCHGPGQNHVKAVESGFAELAIALSAKTPSQQRLKSCVECHAADGSIEPSDPEFTRAQGTTFLFSRCFTAAKDRIGCTTCHDPHRTLDKVTAHYETKCLTCHDGKPAAKATRAPSRTAAETLTEARVCPVNPRDNCISCHMPKVEEPTRKSRFTDHHIRVHPVPK